MKTLGQVLSELLDRLDETTGSETNGTWTNPQLRRYLNEGQRELARITEFFRTSTTVTITTPPVSSVPIPADAIRPYRVEWSQSGITRTLEYRRRQNLDRIWGYWNSQSSGTPQFWTTEGYPGGTGNATGQIVFWPPIGLTGSVNVHYYAYPADFATDGSQDLQPLRVPQGWEDVVVDWAEYRAWRQVRDAAMAQLALDVFRTHVDMLTQASVSDFVADNPGDMIYEPITW